jgi:hypothetical protein
MGLQRKPEAEMPNVRMMATCGSMGGKNNWLKSAEKIVNNPKSYHSNTLPALLLAIALT